MTTRDDQDVEAAEEAEQIIQREIESIREDVSAQVEQAESLLKMFRKLLQRVDIISKRHEDTMAENIKLRAAIRLKDEEIAALQAQLSLLKSEAD